MNWGKSIVVVFIFFVAFIATLVVVCFREDVGLVSKKYYEDDLHYQQQFEAYENANALANKPTVTIITKSLTINYIDFEKIEKGTLTLMRPSNANQDRTFTVKQQADSIQQFELSDLNSGLYKLRLEWTEGTKQYRIDKTIVI
jgi:hypothetical protein